MIGKYKLGDKIGEGALGGTYHASETFQRRPLVLKVLDPVITAHAELREQLCRDLGAAAELRHPRIVKVRDLGEVDGTLYVATDLLTGVDFRQHLKEHRTLTLLEKIELMVQVCGGLAFAHAKGLAHGNIKPSNLFIDGDKRATILDFGIGKCLASVVASGTRPAGLYPNYFAPEQVLGQPFDARSDIFSVALVLYELLAERYPFPAEPGLVPREIVHREPESLRKLSLEIPAELDQLVARALEKDPARRLQKAEEFASGLYLIAKKLQSGQVATPVEEPAAVPAGPEEVAAPVVETAPDPVLKETAENPPAQPVVAEPVIAPVAEAAAGSPAATKVVPIAAKPAPTPAPTPRAAATAKKSSLPRRLITYGVAALLAFCIIGFILSRQDINASQPKAQAPAVAAQPTTAPAVPPKVVEPPEPMLTPPPKAVEAAVPAEPAPAKPSAEQVALSQAKSLWAAGKYAQALGRVEEALAANPQSTEALAWKKKIREAQDAEAAFK